MNEVKTICQLALDEPAPPLRDGVAALAIAKRATMRRNRMRAASSGLAAAAVAGVLVTPAVAGWHAQPATPVADPHQRTATSAASPSAAPQREAPSAHAAPAHGKQMADVLRGVVPAGYALTPLHHDTNDQTVYSRVRPPADGEQILSAHARFLVSREDGQGQLLAAILYDGKPVPTGDLCSPDIAAVLADAGLPCEVVTINGVAIRVTTESDKERGEVKVAIRYLQGGLLMVVSQQGVAPYQPDGARPPDAVTTQQPPSDSDHRPPLATPLLTSQQVAEIAANPAMLP